MIGIIFRLVNEYVKVIVRGHSVTFQVGGDHAMESNLEGLRLNRQGVIKEFPDLKDDANWRKKVIERFKEKIESMKSEDEIVIYLINDLSKYGYIPIAKQRQGHRVEKIK